MTEQYKKSWEKDFISGEVFYRETANLIQHYSQTRTENRLVRSPENVGKSQSLGVELMTGVDLAKWWNMNLSSALYHYRQDIRFEDIQKKIEQLKGHARLNNTFLLSGSWTLKWDVAYTSPMKNMQTKRDGYFVSNLAIKKLFGKGRWNTTLVFNDLFSGERYHEITTGRDFSIQRWRKEMPYMSFTISYTLDNQNK